MRGDESRTRRRHDSILSRFPFRLKMLYPTVRAASRAVAFGQKCANRFLALFGKQSFRPSMALLVSSRRSGLRSGFSSADTCSGQNGFWRLVSPGQIKIVNGMP